MVGTRQAGDAIAPRELVFHDFGHELVGAVLDAFGKHANGQVGRDVGTAVMGDRAQVARGHNKQHCVGSFEAPGMIGARDHILTQLACRQINRVGMLLVDGPGNLGVVRPKAHLVALLGHMPGDRGTPRAGADHADALLHHITYFDFLTENLLSCPWASFLMLER